MVYPRSINIITLPSKQFHFALSKVENEESDGEGRDKREDDAVDSRNADSEIDDVDKTDNVITALI